MGFYYLTGSFVDGFFVMRRTHGDGATVRVSGPIEELYMASSFFVSEDGDFLLVPIIDKSGSDLWGVRYGG
jgi:hypothetical protein